MTAEGCQVGRVDRLRDDVQLLESVEGGLGILRRGRVLAAGHDLAKELGGLGLELLLDCGGTADDAEEGEEDEDEVGVGGTRLGERFDEVDDAEAVVKVVCLLDWGRGIA